MLFATEQAKTVKHKGGGPSGERKSSTESPGLPFAELTSALRDLTRDRQQQHRMNADTQARLSESMNTISQTLQRIEGRRHAVMSHDQDVARVMALLKEQQAGFEAHMRTVTEVMIEFMAELKNGAQRREPGPLPLLMVKSKRGDVRSRSAEPPMRQGDGKLPKASGW